MEKDSPLADADPADLTQALAFVLQFEGKRRVHSADELMARIVAEQLVEHLERSGFVVKKRPPPSMPTTAPQRR
jgi:hypothetical protein